MKTPTPRRWHSSNNCVWSHTLKENSEHSNTICVGTKRIETKAYFKARRRAFCERHLIADDPYDEGDK